MARNHRFTVDETDREIIVTADRPYKFLYYDYNGNFLREKTSEAFYTEITRTTITYWLSI